METIRILHAEEAATFTMRCIAEEQDLPAPLELKFEHYVPSREPVAT